MSFSENLKRARQAKGKKQKDLADFLNVTPSTYCGYETGKRKPDLVKIYRMAAFLGVSVDDLVGFEVFETGEEFQARWNEIAHSSDDPGIEIRHKGGGSQVVIDRRKEKLDGIYHQLDDSDQLQIIKYGEFLLSDPKYKEEPPQS